MTRFFKRPFRMLALLLVSVASTAVQTAYSDTNTSALSRIKDKGMLVLGTSGNMPSMSQIRDDGKVVGFDIDLARFIASGMDVKLDIKTMPFDELLPALEKGDVDMVISNVTINPERNMSVAFVGPYMTSGKCIITKREGLARAEEATDLNTPATRLAALKGSTSAEFVKLLLPEAKLKLVDNFDAALAMINDDKVGGLMTDYPVCLSTLKENPEAGYVTVFSLLSYEPIGIALPGNDSLFINWTENFLKRADGVGLLEELSMRWFGKLTLVAEEK
jgi:polar amino acid transport system substrate-binding protein